MKLIFKFSDALTIEIECEMLVDVYRKMSMLQQAITNEPCGMCGKEKTHFEHRKAGDEGEYDYYSMRCQDCRAELKIGQHKKGGGMYIKRKGADGRWDKEHKGWSRYEAGQETSSAPQQSSGGSTPEDVESEFGSAF